MAHFLAADRVAGVGAVPGSGKRCNARPGPVNLGNPDEVAIVDLACKVIAMTGSGSALLDAPLPEDDPLQRCQDISLARERLPWAPVVGFDSALDKTIASFRDLLGAGSLIRMPASFLGLPAGYSDRVPSRE